MRFEGVQYVMGLRASREEQGHSVVANKFQSQPISSNGVRGHCVDAPMTKAGGTFSANQIVNCARAYLQLGCPVSPSLAWSLIYIYVYVDQGGCT